MRSGLARWARRVTDEALIGRAGCAGCGRRRRRKGKEAAVPPRSDGGGGRGPLQPQGGSGRLPQVRDGAAGGAAGALPERLAGAHPLPAEPGRRLLLHLQGRGGQGGAAGRSPPAARLRVAAVAGAARGGFGRALFPPLSFLQSLGAVFSFISKDAVAKVALLEGHRQQHGFVSLQSLVQHELAAGPAALRARSDSGCRTVLRLHRALRWLQLFLEGLRSGEPRTSVLCTDAYNASLAQHHPWVVRKAATVAFCALPSRDAFLEIMNVGSAEEAVAMLGEAIPYIGDVYSITQELFAQHKLLDLP